MAARRLEAEGPDDGVGGAVQQPDGRPEGVAHDLRGRRGEQRQALRPSQREHLRHLLAEDDVERSDQRKGDRHRDHVRADAREVFAQQVFEQRLQQVGEQRFANESERNADDGDAELAGGEVVVDILRCRRVKRATGFPLSAMSSRRVRRAVTMENSAATNRPLSRTSATTSNSRSETDNISSIKNEPATGPTRKHYTTTAPAHPPAVC